MRPGTAVQNGMPFPVGASSGKCIPVFGWQTGRASLCFEMNTLWAKRDDSPRKHSSMLKYPEDRRSYAGLLFYIKHSMRRLTR